MESPWIEVVVTACYTGTTPPTRHSLSRPEPSPIDRFPLPASPIPCTRYRMDRSGFKYGARNRQISRRDSFASLVSSRLKLCPPGASR